MTLLEAWNFSFFGILMADFKNPFGWSSSRADLFYRCQKKYFFNYYVSELRNVWIEYWLEWLLLKNLTSYKMWLGTHTHGVISDYLHLLADEKWNIDAVNLDKLKDDLFDDMKREFDLAKNRQYDKYDKNLKFGFNEFCYGEEIDEDMEIWYERVWNNLIALVGSELNQKISSCFMKGNKYYIEPKISDFEKMKLILDDDPVLKNVVIRAQPDFGLLWDDGVYYIYDWKSWSKKDVSEDTISDQLKVYACRLLKNMGKTMNDVKIKAYEVYVPSMDVIWWDVVASDVEYIRWKIMDDVMTFSKLLKWEDIVMNKPWDIDRFERTDNVSKCVSCRFRRLCAKLKKVDGDNKSNEVLDNIWFSRDSGALF